MSHERLSYLLRHVPAIIYACDVLDDLRPVFISENIQTIFGYDKDLCLGHTSFWPERLHPEDAPAIFEGVAGALAERDNYCHEYRFRIADGDYRWIRDEMNIVRDGHGQATEIIGTWTDITEQVVSENNSKESESRYRDLSEMSSDWIWETDADLCFSYFSPGFEKKTGINPEYNLGKTRQELSPESLTQEHWRRHLADIDAHREFRNFRYTFTSPDGGERQFVANGRPVHDGKGNFTGYRGTASDFTQLYQARHALEVTKNEAEQANKAKSEFLSSMSHELRTPLNGILGFAQLLQYNPKQPLLEKQQDNVDQIMKSGKHLLDLIDQVLELAKIEAGKVTVSIEDVDISSVLEESLSLIEPMSDKRNIEIIRNEDDFSGVHIRADNLRIKQVLLNLLSNAVKYNNEGGSISVSAEKTETGMLRLFVTDTGPGIPSDKQNSIFIPFERLGHETSDIEGTGIGLTITRELLGIMNGDIGFDSKIGIGTTFWIEIPLQGEAPRAPVEDSKETVRTGAFRIGAESVSYTFLYVEDNPANLALMKSIIGLTHNVRLITAHNAEFGIELAEREIPDLILMDINLPGMDGIEAMNFLRAVDHTRHIPIVAVSASAMNHQVEKGMKQGFSAYLTKPLDIEAFFATVNKILDADA